MTHDDITDLELLKLAAKAAGIERDEDGEFYIQPHQDDCRWWDDGFCTCGAIWDPLDDDGAALRLAVKLEMEIYHAFDDVLNVYASYPVEEGQIQGIQYVVEPHNKDPFTTTRDPLTATRRAIVRAAAEIGRNMK